MLACKNIPLVRSIFGLDERSSYMRAPVYKNPTFCILVDDHPTTASDWAVVSPSSCPSQRLC